MQLVFSVRQDVFTFHHLLQEWPKLCQHSSQARGHQRQTGKESNNINITFGF